MLEQTRDSKIRFVVEADTGKLIVRQNDKEVKPSEPVAKAWLGSEKQAEEFMKALKNGA